MKSDVVLLPGLHGSRALFSSFVALAPAWADCRPLALPTVGGQSFDEIADAILPELRSLEGLCTVVEIEGPHLIVQTRPVEVWAAISEEFETAA